MDVPQTNPAAGFPIAQDYESKYEARIIKYLLTRYKVPRHEKDQLYNTAEETLGVRRPTIALLSQIVELPLLLRSRVIYRATELLTIGSVLNGKAISGPVGKNYQDILDSFPDLLEMNYVIGMCFGYPYLKTSGSAASLVLHNGTPTLDEVAETPGIILCQGYGEREVWAIEPLGRLLDRLDQGDE